MGRETMTALSNCNGVGVKKKMDYDNDGIVTTEAGTFKQDEYG